MFDICSRNAFAVERGEHNCNDSFTCVTQYAIIYFNEEIIVGTVLFLQIIGRANSFDNLCH